MKNLIKLSMMVIALTMTIQSFGQVRFGLKGGLNIANMLAKNNDETFDAKPINSFHFGATAEYPFRKDFAVETGLLFSTKGVKQEEQGEFVSLHLNYLEIPINAVYKMGSGNTKFLIHAGPYLGFAMSGTWKSSVPSLFGFSSGGIIEIGNDKENDTIKPLDFGLNFGAGVEIKDITIGFQYGLGLANILVVSENGSKFNNRVMGISAGYKFGGKSKKKSQ